VLDPGWRQRAGHTTQRTVLYLGEINDTQQAAWRKRLDALNEATQLTEPICLFPASNEPGTWKQARVAQGTAIEASAAEARRSEVSYHALFALESRIVRLILDLFA
jgi:hypothetical protein